MVTLPGGGGGAVKLFVIEVTEVSICNNSLTRTGHISV